MSPLDSSDGSHILCTTIKQDILQAILVYKDVLMSYVHSCIVDVFILKSAHCKKTLTPIILVLHTQFFICSPFHEYILLVQQKSRERVSEPGKGAPRLDG